MDNKDLYSVMDEVAQLIPTELFIRLGDAICKEIEDACEAEEAEEADWQRFGKFNLESLS